MVKRKGIDCGSGRARFCRERQFSPSRCIRGTTRTVKSGKSRIIVCRVKGGRGKTRAQSILRPMGSPKCNVCSIRR
jgi:hypothetical protein